MGVVDPMPTLPLVRILIPGLAPVVICKGVAASVANTAFAPEKTKLTLLVLVMSL